MPTPKKLRPIPGSHVVHLPGAQAASEVHHEDRVQVTVVLEPSKLSDDHPAVAKLADTDSLKPQRREQLSFQEFEQVQSAHPNHYEAIRQFAKEFSLEVVEESRVRHDVVLEGPVRAINEAFGIQLEHYEHDNGSYRAHSGPVQIPEELHGVVQGVLGLDEIPAIDEIFAADPADTDAGQVTFAPMKVADHYDFPTHDHQDSATTGQGQRVAILCFGGGYWKKDMEQFFGKNMPVINHFSVDGSDNDPLDYDTLKEMIQLVKANEFNELVDNYKNHLADYRHTLEVTMDIQLVGALANAAEIDVYYARASTDSFRRAIFAALGDTKTHPEPAPGRDQPAAISMSWGKVEYGLTHNAMKLVNQALIAAKNLNVTFCCASGDYGSRGSSGNDRDLAAVSFPASSPYALACGGTGFVCSDGKIVSEKAWNGVIGHGIKVATGGGISGEYEMPDFQKSADVPATDDRIWISEENKKKPGFRGRGVPDVAANAAFTSAYEIVLGGESFYGIGTSAAAPVWAALIARLNQCLGARVGWLTKHLYHKEVSRAFQEILHGDNDICDGKLRCFSAHKGWNACTGWGTPLGTDLLHALSEDDDLDG